MRIQEVAALFLFGLSASRLGAATIEVPAQQATIQGALDAAAGGDVVLVAPGEYELAQPLVFRGKAVTLRSAGGPEKTILRAVEPADSNRASIVAFEDAEPEGASLEGFTLTGGRGTLKDVEFATGAVVGRVTARVGGAIYCGPHAAPRIIGNIFRENRADHGGAILCDVDSAPEIRENSFLENQAGGEPGADPGSRGGALACLADSMIRIEGGVFSLNKSLDGGALHVGGGATAELRQVRFEDNSAEDDGGAIVSHGVLLTISECTFLRNKSSDRGGALIAREPGFVLEPALRLRVEDSTFQSNEADEGGAVVLDVPASIFPRDEFVQGEVVKCSFVSNLARFGGALTTGYEAGLCRVQACRFADNGAYMGGAVYCGYDSATSLQDCAILGNTATAYGGGVFFGDAWWLDIEGSTIAGNAAGYSGGGLYGSLMGLQVSNSIIWGNAGGSVVPPYGPTPFSLAANYSCIESNPSLLIPVSVTGVGSIDEDPQFRGWETAEVHVDASRAEPGDGTPASPYRDLKDALKGYSYELLPTSPTLGAGEGGANMGAGTGVSAGPRVPSRVVRLAEGSYRLEGASLAGGVSLLGQGAGKTVLSGESLVGLRSDATLSELTVTGAPGGGILVGAGEEPVIQAVEVTQNESFGLRFDLRSGGQVLQSVISQNAGPGLQSHGAEPVLVSCTITDNRAPTQGGGVDASSAFLSDSTLVVLEGCLVARNSAIHYGGGIYANQSARVALTHCTVAGNLAGLLGGGLRVEGGALVSIESSIVWGNGGESAAGSGITASYSAIEGDAVFPGEGNINSDPLFCAWGSGADVHVSAASPGPGDGSPGNPFKDIGDALSGYSYSLLSTSPCIGSGKAGSSMGADLGTCSAAGSPARVVHVAEGAYEAEILNLTQSVSIQGAGKDKTVIQGTVAGLRTGSTLSALTVAGCAEDGILVVGRESPVISSCAVEGNGGYGLMCQGSCTPQITECAFTGNKRGGIRCASGAEPRLERCSISRNPGQGIACIASSPKLKTCDIIGNIYPQGAGVSCTDASPEFEDCIIAENVGLAGESPSSYYGSTMGAGVLCSSSSAPFFLRTTIAGNAAMLGGGICSRESSRPVLKDCIVWGNAGSSVLLDTGFLTASYSCIEDEAPWPGTGNTNADPLFCGWGAAAEVHVDSSSAGPGDGSAENPYPDFGTALAGFNLALSPGSPCIASGSTGGNMGAERGSCEGPAGARRTLLVAPGQYSLRGTSLAFQVSVDGAGEGATVLDGVVQGLRDGASVSRLTVTGEGGCIAIGHASPEISQVTVEMVAGIGLWGYRSSAVVSRCTIRENWAGVFWSLGNPVFRECQVARSGWMGMELHGTTGLLESCIFAENLGTGLSSVSSSPVLTNCLFTGNAMGGVDVSQGGSPTFANCVMSGNKTDAVGGGILCQDGAPAFINCIVWGNLPDSIWLVGGQARPTIEHSCVEGASPWPGEGNIDDDPLFVKAGTYDFERYQEVLVGNTYLWIPDFVVEAPDYHLQSGSPALDAGTEKSAPSTDMGGVPRPSCGAVDMGIYESADCPEPVPFQRGDCNDDGKKDITDPIFTLAYLFLGGPRPSCLKSADVNDDGKLDITDPIYLLSHLFLGGPRPHDPFAACGLDPTADSLSCGAFAHCP